MAENLDGSIWIAYLGKRGGGLHLLRQTEKLLINSNFSLLSIVSGEKISLLENQKILFTPSLNLYGIGRLITFPFLSFLHFYRNRKHLPLALIQIMPSPMDFWLDIWGHLFGVEIFRAVHDYERHPGEIWPTSGEIRRRINFATRIFVFSDHVSQNLPKSSAGKVFQCILPDELENDGSISLELKEEVRNLERPIVLFIGRIRKYKGLEFLLDSLGDYSKVNFSILVAGSGLLNVRNYKNVCIWNHWLSDSEVDFLLTEANIVVFPYMEASQSGLMPMAKKKNKVILATNVGSFEEQLIGYQRKVLVDYGDSEGLIIGLETCLPMANRLSESDINYGALQSITLGDQVMKLLINESKS
jgi:glycosyltransferase involved in cell wall biosynthesis